MELERLVREYCRRQGLLDGVGRVAAGVSGGADSVCLLRVLAALRQEGGPQVTAVHVLHGIRGEEAMEDAQFVRQLCARWEVPFRLFSFDVPQLARERGCSLEEAGRQARFERIIEYVYHDKDLTPLAGEPEWRRKKPKPGKLQDVRDSRKEGGA